ncbi:MAG: DNA polymerase IV [Defluviitaleaceae bacterium]|nr:DNA polymerase IV [Defluviitaleaceae bacterium]
MSARSIIHVDMDAFFAAVEVRDNPALAGKPLIIGALPRERGVVATCSYEARKYGVRSAMSIKEAYRRCPHGVYMHPSHGKYSAVSRDIKEIWATYTDLLECMSIDEGYLDVTRSAHLFGGAVAIGQDIKARTLAQVGLTCSVGIGYSMMSAKIASEEDKPDGFFQIPDVEALTKLIIDRNVRAIYGIGAQTAAVLDKNGITTVRDILNNQKRVRELMGSHGDSIVRLAQGVDNRAITVAEPAKSIGNEHTFQRDITDFEYLRDALRLIAKKLSFKIRMKGLYCKTVTLKVTFANMVQITRSKSGDHISTTAEIFAVASDLLGKVERKPIRLVGISLSGFSTEPVEQLDMFKTGDIAKNEALEGLLLGLQYKYGINKIVTGREWLVRKNMDNDEV